MSLLIGFLNDPAPPHLVRLCLYLLYFFAGERPAVWDALKEIDRGTAVVHPQTFLAGCGPRT